MSAATTQRGMTVLESRLIRDLSYQRTPLGLHVAQWKEWLTLGGHADRTIEQYERNLARLCLLFPEKDIHEITDGDLLILAGRFHDKERRTRMASISSFFKWAKASRRITENPCEFLPRMKHRPQPLIDVFTDPEVEAILSLPTRDAAPCALLLEAGLRNAEARAMTVRRCLPESGYVLVIQGKGGKDRAIPMSDRLQTLLADLILTEGLGQDQHILYATHYTGRSSWTGQENRRTYRRDSPIGEGTFNRWWRRCLSEADVKYRNPHTARHTFATRWRNRGLAIDDLQILLGHSSIATTKDLYVHTNVHDVAARMKQLQEAL